MKDIRNRGSSFVPQPSAPGLATGAKRIIARFQGRRERQLAWTSTVQVSRWARGQVCHDCHRVVQLRQWRAPRSHGLLLRLGSAWYNECRGASDSQAGQAGLTDGLYHTAKPWEVSEPGCKWACQGIEGLSKINICLELSGTQSLADGDQRRWALPRTGHTPPIIVGCNSGGQGLTEAGRAIAMTFWSVAPHSVACPWAITCCRDTSYMAMSVHAAYTTIVDPLQRHRWNGRPVSSYSEPGSVQCTYCKACRGCLWALFRYQTPLHVSAAIKKHHPSAEKGPKRHSWTFPGSQACTARPST